MSTAFLTIGHATKRFWARAAVDDVSLEIASGEAIAILGPSGCGKTTLLRLIAGLEMLDAGEIWLNGRQVAGPHRSLVAPHERGIGFVFQDLALWPHLTVQQTLDFVLASVKMPKSERQPRAHDTLRLVGIEQLAARYPHELSGGEQQRASLARALVAQPRLLLLDEPLSSLDPELRATLRIDLARLQATTGVTMIYVTHDREDAVILADRVVDMRAGRIVAVRGNERKGVRA